MESAVMPVPTTVSPPKINLPKPVAVIFDWDDTIVDSWQTAMIALNAALTGMGGTAWTDDEARRRCGTSARDLFQNLFGERWQEADKIYYDTFTKTCLQTMRIHDDAEALLKTLAKNNVYLAVVSNKRGALLRTEAAHIQFTDYFGKIIGAGDAVSDKPHPAPVQMALADSGIAAGRQVWFIGDSHTDMLCAVNAGCTPVLIESKPPPEEMLVDCMPAHRFKKLFDVMTCVEDFFL
jgi:phosphoglycolate phosphatase